MLSVQIEMFLELHPYLKVPERLLEDLSNLEDLPYINGCGAANGLTRFITPTTIDDICVLAACIIHDAEYYYGETLEDKLNADTNLLYNINLILLNAVDSITISLERRQYRFNLGYEFFHFVHEFGLKAYVAGKDIPIRKREGLENIIHVTKLIGLALTIPIKIFMRVIRLRASNCDKDIFVAE